MIARFRDSPLARVLAVGFLVLLLQIPVGIIAHTIDERRTTRGEAIAEVTRTWGGAQELIGPILNVPFAERWKDPEGKEHERIAVRHFLPHTLVVRGQVEAEVRRRGIFEVPLYVASLHLEGTFRIASEELLWQRATLSFGISDPKAIRSISPLALGARSVEWEPGPSGAEMLSSGVSAPLAVAPTTFSFDVTLAGSGRLSVVPTGSDTSVSLASGWPDPGFDGAWLPIERAVSDAGFRAEWRVSRISRSFPSTWTNGQVDQQRLSAGALGVNLLSPVDTYRTNDRAVKYALLFLGLTFLCVTLFELLGRLRVHPIQYLLVGLALCLFYLLLLPLSEQLGFLRAYLIAAGATVWLVTMYVRFVLASAGRALTIGAILSGLYGFLYVLLQIQDYALLVGSVGLFAALGTVMWITRRVDWYALAPGAAKEACR
jgi:inner membrane protein